MNNEKKKPLRTLDAVTIVAVLLIALSLVGQDFAGYLVALENTKDTVLVTFKIENIAPTEQQYISNALEKGETEYLVLHTADHTLGTITELLSETADEEKEDLMNGRFTTKGKQKGDRIVVEGYGELKTGENLLVYLGKKGYFLEIIALSVVESHKNEKNT